MTGGKRIKLLEKERLCFDYLKGDHCSWKFTSKSTCFQKYCAHNHCRSLYDYFIKKEIKDKLVEANKKVSLSDTLKKQNFFIQIAPVKGSNLKENLC